jgi:hypothetical protein
LGSEENKEPDNTNRDIDPFFNKQEQQSPLDSEDSESNEALSYSNNKLGITLEHPTDWKVGSLKNGIQVIKEENGVYVEIRKHNIESPDEDLKQYAGVVI